MGLFFLHMRKAGGTTIRAFLGKVAKRYNLEFVINEGRRGKVEMPTANGSTFYVTNLREPMARILSHYKYSGRWACRVGKGIKRIRSKRTGELASANNSLSLENFFEQDL